MAIKQVMITGAPGVPVLPVLSCTLLATDTKEGEREIDIRERENEREREGENGKHVVRAEGPLSCPVPY